MPPEPLNDSDFERLANVLQRVDGRRAMNVEQLDVLFAALIYCPSEVAKAEYLPGTGETR
jgi:hypothetical protein